MEGGRFDAWARGLASRMSRRGAVRAAGAVGAGALAGGSTASAAAQSDRRLVTCEWRIDAEVSSGPSRERRFDGLLTIVVDRDGWIDEATLEVDSIDLPRPIYSGVGTANGRTLDLRLEGGECEVLAFTGVSDEEIRSCNGELAGSFQGPRLTDLGGWRTSRDGVCEPGKVFDDETCTCIDDDACIPQACANGEVWEEKYCACVCEPSPCLEGEGWSRSACECVPRTDECEGVACNTWEYLDTETCTCRCVAQQCSTDGAWVWSEDACDCVCSITTCATGGPVDQATCSCGGDYCVEDKCSIREEWDWESCSCRCVAAQCQPRYEWSYDSCSCVCSPAPCANGGTRNPQTCECDCPFGWTNCGNYCADLMQDPDNCGACGSECGPAAPKCGNGYCY